MRLEFTATEVGFDEQYAIVCGLQGDGKWLVFQRSSEGAKDDWGVHLEFCDQANSEYDCIASCRIRQDTLSVDLSKPLGKLKGVVGFDVNLRINADAMTALKANLRRVFRGFESLLTGA